MSLAAAAPFLILAAALALDGAFGEPPTRRHPLAAFGGAAALLERAARKAAARPSALRGAGMLCVIVLIVPVSFLAHEIAGAPWLGPVFEAVLLYFAIAPRSLAEHAQAVAGALEHGRLDEARAAVGRMVSRDTGAMSGDEVARGAVESVLENGNDAVFGAIFWFALLGAAGALAYRLANTLDAMWGYRDGRYAHFGWAAARLDDLLNLAPARLTALTYAALGRTGAALGCWRTQARAWYSPNAGPVMAAGAGALEVRLGGAACYGGRLKPRPELGCGAAPTAADIGRAVALIRRGLVLWVLALGAVCAVRALP